MEGFGVHTFRWLMLKENAQRRNISDEYFPRCPNSPSPWAARSSCKVDDTREIQRELMEAGVECSGLNGFHLDQSNQSIVLELPDQWSRRRADHVCRDANDSDPKLTGTLRLPMLQRMVG
jgi:hypothetical protein